MLVPLSLPALAACVAFLAAPAVPVPVRVVFEGKPVAGAKVWAYAPRAFDEGPSPLSPPAVTDAEGRARVVPPLSTGTWPVFARDSEGRIGEGSTRSESGTIELAANESRPGRVTDAAGKPVAGATISPFALSDYTRYRAKGGPGVRIGVPVWDPPTVTDTGGRFALATPAGYELFFRVDVRNTTPQWFSVDAATRELNVVTRDPGAVTLKIAGVDPGVLSGASWQLRFENFNKRGTGVSSLRVLSGTFDGTASEAIPSVVPGRYTLHVFDDARRPAVLVASTPVEVKSGETTTLTATFGPAATVTGKVVTKAGKGVAGATVTSNVFTGKDFVHPKHHLSTTTGADGSYTLHGPAGWYRPWLNPQAMPEGYALSYRPNDRIPTAEVKSGQSRAMPPIELVDAVTCRGRLALADGKPAAGATVFIEGFRTISESRNQTVGAGGEFTFKNLPPDDAISPRARLGKAVNVPEAIELSKLDGPVTIRLSEANAAAFAGRVTDAAGQPLAGAKATLTHWVNGVGHSSSMSTVGSIVDATADAQGRFAFTALWPTDRYTLQITADGYAPAIGQETRGEAGQTHDYGTIKLARSSLVVAGVVRDAVGKPVAGAELFAIDGPERVATTSAADGSFSLAGYTAAPGWVFAQKPGYRLAAVPVTPGQKQPAAVVIRSIDAPPAAPPAVSAEHKAALDRFTRHLLTRMWEARDRTTSGPFAIADMARFDLATAKKWRDEEKARPGGKDYSGYLSAEERGDKLFATAVADIDEAVALIQGTKGDAFASTLALAERLLPVDKAKAARIAEEAAVLARRHGLPDRVYDLARVGELVAKAGNVAGGKKLLAEAADQAEKLDASGRGRTPYLIGAVVCRLAPYDWPRAEAMLATFKNPSEYNRWLAASAARLSERDLSKAEALLTQFKPANSFDLAYARLKIATRVCADRPAEAERLVAAVTESAIRFQGYVALARKYAPTDKARAARMIDRAFAVLDAERDDLSRWGSSGGRSGLAAVAIARAAETGYPDLANLVNRALALRPIGNDAHGLDEKRGKLVNTAAALALTDPDSARRILTTFAPPDAYVEQALSQSRDWLFALALADPDRATALVDKIFERAEARRPDGGAPLSLTGVIELGTILTAPDRLIELENYGSLLRERDIESY